MSDTQELMRPLPLGLSDAKWEIHPLLFGRARLVLVRGIFIEDGY